MKLENRQKQATSSKVLMGLAAVGATGSASGALVQIDLIGNMITAGGGNQLNADFTGDAVPDISISRATFINDQSISFYQGVGYFDNMRFSAVTSYGANYFVRLGGNQIFFQVGGLSDTVNFPVTFDGQSLGLGEGVEGVVSFLAGGEGSTRGVYLNSLVFDDGTGTPVTASTDITGATVIGSTENGVYTGGTVPEPSSLALLALGAAGVVTRRQRKKAA